MEVKLSLSLINCLFLNVAIMIKKKERQKEDLTKTKKVFTVKMSKLKLLKYNLMYC